MNGPHIYHHSKKEISILLILGMIAVAIVLGPQSYSEVLKGYLGSLIILIALIFGMLLFAIYSLSVATLVSETEIAAQRFWIKRSLAWEEIQRVSGSITGIQLLNMDTGITVSIDSQIPGYEAVLEQIDKRRPDLFSSPEFTVLEHGPRYLVLNVVFMLLLTFFIGYIFFTIYKSWFAPIAAVAIGAAIFLANLTSLQSVRQEGNTLRLKYVFKETIYHANEIKSVDLSSQYIRKFGRIRYLQLTLKNGESIPISGLPAGTSVTYLVLKEWHKRQTGRKFSV